MTPDLAAWLAEVCSIPLCDKEHTDKLWQYLIYAGPEAKAAINMELKESYNAYF